MRKLFRDYHKLIAFILVFVFTAIYGLIAVTSHNKFETFGWDLGYFDQLIWKISKGTYPLSSLSKVNLLAGHFSPILYLYAPLYWLWADPRMLIIAQVIQMTFAGYLLYRFSYTRTKNKFFSFSILLSYLLFQGTQWSILNEFHELTIAPLIIILTFTGLEKKNDKLFWISIIVLLLVKEEMALLVSAIFLTAYFHYGKKMMYLLSSFTSLIFFFFITQIFIPSVSEQKNLFHPYIVPGAKTPLELIVLLVKEPTLILENFITPRDKLITLLTSFLSFGFLPLISSLSFLIPVAEQFVMRFLYLGPQYTTWLNVNHHASPLAMLMPIAAIFGAVYSKFSIKFKIMNTRLDKYHLLGSILLIFTIFSDILLKLPIHSILKSGFYNRPKWIEDNMVIVEKMNKLDAISPISTNNSFFPHLSRRNNIYLLPEIGNAKYLVVDLMDGPNKSSPLSHIELEQLIQTLISDNKFKVIESQNNAYILERIER